MAKPPSFIKRVNGLVDIFESNCSDNWYLYVKSAVLPLGRMVLGFLGFGMGDVIRGAVKPKVLRSGRHGPRKGTRGRGLPIPEIGNMLGSKVPDVAGIREPTASKGQVAFWKIDDIIQKRLFHWMVIDLVSGFFFDWSSNILSSRAGSSCGEPGATGFNNFQPLGTALIDIDEVQGGLLAINNYDYIEGYGSVFSDGFTNTVPHTLVVFTVTIKNIGFSGRSTAVGLAVQPLGNPLPEPYWADVQSVFLNPFASHKYIVTAEIFGFANVSWRWGQFADPLQPCEQLQSTVFLKRLS